MTTYSAQAVHCPNCGQKNVNMALSSYSSPRQNSILSDGAPWSLPPDGFPPEMASSETGLGRCGWCGHVFLISDDDTRSVNEVAGWFPGQNMPLGYVRMGTPCFEEIITWISGTDDEQRTNVLAAVWRSSNRELVRRAADTEAHFSMLGEIEQQAFEQLYISAFDENNWTVLLLELAEKWANAERNNVRITAVELYRNCGKFAEADRALSPVDAEQTMENVVRQFKRQLTRESRAPFLIDIH